MSICQKSDHAQASVCERVMTEAHRDVPCVFAQLEQLQTELSADRESLRSAESLSADLLKEKAQLEKTLETLQENSDRQVNFTHTDRKTCYTAVSCQIDNVIHFITRFSCPTDKIIDSYTVKKQMCLMSQLSSGRALYKTYNHVRFI